MNPTTRQNQIDAYLRGELNASELKDFESFMENDPSFSDQVRFEQKIQKGLTEVRKAELKARLDSIDVSPGWFGGVGQLTGSTAMKTLGGVIVASVAGVLIFNSIDSEITKELIKPEVELLGEVSSPEPIGKAEPVVIPDKKSITQLYSSIESDGDASKQAEGVNTDTSPSQFEDKQKVAVADEVIAEFVPNVEVPQPGDLSKEEGLSTPESDVPDMSKSDEINSRNLAAVEVETIHKKNESLKYKYFDGKLFLYGDFNDNPYEILEINGAADRRLFLFFDKSFYSIEITDKIRELLPISNRKLVSELEIIRNNKL